MVDHIHLTILRLTNILELEAAPLKKEIETAHLPQLIRFEAQKWLRENSEVAWIWRDVPRRPFQEII